MSGADDQFTVPLTPVARLSLLQQGTRHLQQQLATLPPNVRAAVLLQNTPSGPRLGVAIRSKKHWQVAGDVSLKDFKDFEITIAKTFDT